MNKVWPKYEDDYYYISDRGKILCAQYDGSQTDMFRKLSLNMFRTSELAKNKLTQMTSQPKAEDGMWCTSGDGENFSSEPWKTKEDAIQDGKNGYGGDRFWVGQITAVTTNQFIDVECLLDQANESACEECGEFAEDFLTDVKDKDKESLQKIISNFLILKGYNPTFYSIKNVEEIK